MLQCVQISKIADQSQRDASFKNLTAHPDNTDKLEVMYKAMMPVIRRIYQNLASLNQDEVVKFVNDMRNWLDVLDFKHKDKEKSRLEKV